MNLPKVFLNAQRDSNALCSHFNISLAGEIIAEHLGRQTDDLEDDAVSGLAQFLQPFVAAERQPR